VFMSSMKQEYQRAILTDKKKYGGTNFTIRKLENI